MANKKIRIELPSKDTMLFIANDLLNLNLKDSISKKSLLEKVFKFYKENDNITKLLNILSTDAIYKLKKVYEAYLNKEDFIELFLDKYYTLEIIDVMLIYVKIEGSISDDQTFYVYDKEVFDKLELLFNDKYKSIIKNNQLLEQVVMGILYSYGVIRSDYFLAFVNDYLKTNYTLDELYDLIYSNLYLNQAVNKFTIHWKNIDEEEEYISYMDYSDELALVCEDQKNRNFEYNIHELNYLVDRSKSVVNDKMANIVDYLKSIDNKANDDEIAKFIRACLMGLDNSLEHIKNILNNMDEDKLDECLEYITNWHNDLEMYSLCGYAPNSIKDETFVS